MDVKILIGAAIVGYILLKKKGPAVVRSKPIAVPAIAAPTSQPSFQQQATATLGNFANQFAIAEAPKVAGALGDALNSAFSSSDDFASD